MVSNKTYIPLTEAHLEETIDFAITCFIKNEHITKVLNMCYDDLYPLTDWLCRMSLEQQLGYIAYDSQAQEVIGFFLAKEPSTAFTADLNEKMSVIATLSTQLMAKAMQLPFARERFCHLLFIGFTDDPGKRKGANFHEFFKYCLGALRAKHRYKYLYMECTNTRSQKLARFYRGKALNEILYADISPEYPLNNTDLQEVSCISFLMVL